MPKFTIITCYHFNRGSNPTAYALLLRSLKSSIEQVKDCGRVVLVANGMRDEYQAEDPAVVLAELGVHNCPEYETVQLDSNQGSAGGLNAGVIHALARPCGPDEWIGSVQSSAILGPQYLDHLNLPAASGDALALFGRLVYEHKTEVIWADGHFLKAGIADNFNGESSVESANPHIPQNLFPCLSACFYHGRLVNQIVAKYGNFAHAHFPHYGDCLDVALRARAVSPGNQFRYCPGAVAQKRTPKINVANLQTARLMAASLYYEGKNEEAEMRLARKCETAKYAYLWDCVPEDAFTRLARDYCPEKGITPPKVSGSFDPEWGHDA